MPRKKFIEEKLRLVDVEVGDTVKIIRRDDENEGVLMPHHGNKKWRFSIKRKKEDYMCFSAISPTIGSLNFSPLYALNINMSQRITVIAPIAHDNHTSAGMPGSKPPTP